MLFIGILRRNQVAKVYGIETAPKKTNFHKPATMSASAPMEQGRVFRERIKNSGLRHAARRCGKNLGH